MRPDGIGNLGAYWETLLKIDGNKATCCIMAPFRIDVGERVRLYNDQNAHRISDKDLRYNSDPDDYFLVSAVQILNEEGIVKFQFGVDEDVVFK